jgi:hypothetical protein
MCIVTILQVFAANSENSRAGRAFLVFDALETESKKKG